jgi:RNA polymerase sigma factor (sigma-70 family)
MPERLLRRLVNRLWANVPAAGDLPSDGELLDRYSCGRDEAAFELLVRRHGALVLGVCRRTLHDEHAAEDAFQATFLVLARKARSVRQATVAGWLYRVALRVALRARQTAARRTIRQQPFEHEPSAADPDRLAAGELRAVLDDELGRLPERFRLPVLLCYVEGHTTEQAARLLGCPRGTVLSRLATARKRLASRLARRGVGLPVAGLAAGLAESAWSDEVPAPLAAAAVRGAFSFSAAPAPAAQLAEGVIHAMFLSKVRYVFASVLILSAIAAVAGRVAFDAPAQGQDRAPEGAARKPQPEAKAPPAQDRPRVQPARESEKRPVDPQVEGQAQLERAKKELEQRMSELELIERQHSRFTMDLRLKLLALEEELRGLERTRDAELAAFRSRLEQAEKTPASIFGELPREIDDLSDRLRELQKLGKPDDPMIERLKKALVDRRNRLADDKDALRQGGLTVEKRFAEKSLPLRKEILTLEEQLRLVERRAGRELSQAEASVDAAAARIRQLEGLPTAGRPNAELERRLGELMREMAALRKELKRQREGK